MPATLTGSATDTALASDVASRAALIRSRSAAETALATDVAGRVTRFVRTAADTALGADTASRTHPVVRSASEAVHATNVALRTAPPNDNEANAFVITGLSGTYSPYSTVDATMEAGELPLPGTVTDDVGSVWFHWAPDFDGVATFTTNANTGLTAFTAGGSDPTGWRTIQWPGNTNYFSASYVKLYVVHVASTTGTLRWTAPALPVDDVTGLMSLQLYLLSANPGDITASTFTPTFTNHVVRNADGTAGAFSTVSSLSVGNHWIIAQQTPTDVITDVFHGNSPGDPLVGWDPGVDIGSFTNTSNTPVAVPFDTVVQVTSGLVAIPGPFAPGVLLNDGTPTVAWPTRSGEAYDIRAYPLTKSAESIALSLGWATAASSVNLTLPITMLSVTPTSLAAYVVAELPGETLTFTIVGDPTVRVTAVTGADGSALVNVPIDFMADGSYDLLVVSDSGRSATVPFTVAATVVVTPPPSTDSVVPDLPPPVVNRWVLHDLVTDTDWAFPINPLTVDSVMMPNLITDHVTTAVGGSPILFEGSKRSKAWQFTGHVLTLTDRLELESWAKKPYRVILTDDFGRRFIIKVTSVAMTYVRDFLHPEHHTYQASALLYGRTP